MSCSDYAEKRRAAALSDTRSTQEFIRRALELDDDSEEYHFICYVFHLRATREVLDVEIRLLDSDDQPEVDLGCFILRALGGPEHAVFVDESVEALLARSKGTSDMEIAIPIIYALGMRCDSRAIPEILSYKDYHDEDVRWAVVCSLLHYSEIEQVTRALIDFTHDTDSEIRDHAAFLLAEINGMDTPLIRTALCDCLLDEDPFVRGYAAKGLALRKDDRAIPAIFRGLEEDSPAYPFIEAAAELADPVFYPLLNQVNDWDDTSEYYLAKAREACKPGEHAK